MCEYREIDTTSPPNTPSVSSTTTEESTGGNCPICQHAIKGSYLVRRFSCGHLVHQNCLTAITKSCPICRKELEGEEMLCHICYTPISCVFARQGRAYQQCPKCFRGQLQEEIERLKVSLITMYRHSVGFDKECFVIKQSQERGFLEQDDAYRQMVSAQELFMSTILDYFTTIL